MPLALPRSTLVGDSIIVHQTNPSETYFTVYLMLVTKNEVVFWCCRLPAHQQILTLTFYSHKSRRHCGQLKFKVQLVTEESKVMLFIYMFDRHIYAF